LIARPINPLDLAVRRGGAVSVDSGVNVLVVDDHLDMANLVAGKLAEQGWRARVAGSGSAALAVLAEHTPDLVVTDLRMPGADGLDVLDASQARDPAVPVIVMTAFGEVATAVEAMRRGAWHFVVKPIRLTELVGHARRALAERGVRRPAPLLGGSPAIQDVVRKIARVAPASAPVLVRGETGTGKELVARAIHDASGRRELVAVNCTSLPEGLVESELFGHARGAFTGAVGAHAGVFVQADGGTLFLDEIGDMPLALQAKLLRVLQDGEVRAIGGDAPRKVDVRVIAATHQDLEARVRTGQFREDLFYRLDVVPITVPPLRDRLEDLPLLAEHLFARARATSPHSVARRLAPDLVAALARYAWPGNVRELANVMERLAISAEREELTAVDLEALAPHVCGARSDGRDGRLATIREITDDHIARVLAHCGGNKPRAAQILGVDLSTIYRRAKRR
jgi:two-component system response regulator HydG